MVKRNTTGIGLERVTNETFKYKYYYTYAKDKKTKGTTSGRGLDKKH